MSKSPEPAATEEEASKDEVDLEAHQIPVKYP